MLKVHCHVSKKIPIPSKEFSSQSFACGLEAELADAADANVLKAKAEELFSLVQRAVEDEIENASAIDVNGPAAGRSQPNPLPPPRQQGQRRLPPAQNGGGNGNGRNRKPNLASEAQCRAIFALSKATGYELSALLDEYGVAQSEALTMRAASELIDRLKSVQQGCNGTPANR